MRQQALKNNSQALIKALADGDLIKAESLRANGARINLDQKGLYKFLGYFLKEHSDSFFSRQVNPDLCSRIVTFDELDKACGPFYLSVRLYGIGPKPKGWASFGFADRLLSWLDDGFGVLGTQVVNLQQMLVSSKPMSAYADAIIAGPLPYDDLEVAPEGFIAPDLHAIGIRNGKVSDELFCKLFLQFYGASFDFEWTKNFAAAQYTEEVLEAVRPMFISSAKKSPKKFPQVALYAAVLEDECPSENKSEVLLTDSGKRQLAIIRAALGACATSKASRKRRILAKEIEKLHVVGQEEKVLKQLSSILVQDGKTPVTIEELESFKQYFRRHEFPVLSAHIELVCQHLAVSLYNAADKSGKDELLPRLAFCGWRPAAALLLLRARQDESGQLLRRLLEAGMSPHGHVTEHGIFSPLIGEALHSNPASVEILLKAGADPLEPTHYNGTTTLEHVRWTVEDSGDPVSPALAQCLELLEAAAAGDPRTAWMCTMYSETDDE